LAEEHAGTIATAAAYDERHVSDPRRLALLACAALLIAACGGASSPHQGPASTRAAAPSPALDPAIAPAHEPRRVPTGPRDAPVAILMYHVIATPPAGTPYPELWVAPDRFVRTMRALARAGYHATTLGAVWRAWHGHGTMPRHPIVVSFDDGYQSQSTVARRELDRLGWPGVLNLEVDNVRLKGGIAHSQVAAMLRDGWELDAHTLTHPDLTTVDPARLHREVAGSRQWLRRAFGVPVAFFCYPAGRYDARTEAAVRAAGYDGATTTQPGVASPHSDPYALPRQRVTPQMTPADVVALARAPARG
jgi:peptidoglycan/xylan/chitin deacetylase (PgdA/CDA1 family)